MPKKKQSWSKKGSTKLSKVKKFSWKKYLPVIIAIALVGGFFVWRSFAGTKLYDYQYSVYQCDGGKFSNKLINPDDKCIEKSAESFVYRMYDAARNKAPDSKGYQYWVQKLAGDRTQPSEAAASFITSLKDKNNEQFVDALYNNAFGRKADTKGKAYWKGKLDKKEWSRERVLAHFAATSESVRKNKAAFATFLSRAPRVKVVQTALKKRDENLYKAAVNASNAKKQADSIKAMQTVAKQAKDTAASTAKKSTISLKDLTSMQNNDKTVRDNLAKIEKIKATIKTLVNSNKKLYDESYKVEQYSPDISAKDINKNYADTLKFYNAVDIATKELGTYLKDIASSYKSAEDKYAKAHTPPPEKRRKIVADTMFQRPKPDCYAVQEFEGRIGVTWFEYVKDGKNYRARIDAVNCILKDVSARKKGGWNRLQVFKEQACSWPYKAEPTQGPILMGANESAPDGYVCMNTLPDIKNKIRL